MSDNTLVLSLVRAYLLTNPGEHLSWVPAYTTVRWVRKRANVVHVGGHYRRKALYAKLLSSIACTCKLQELVYPENMTLVCPPPVAIRERHDEESSALITRVNRQLSFS